MVKPDVKHNYYADLDLPASATIDDVRKAYRKLALQYHPDRNAGKEEECIPKFQAIQAANEVLSDPTNKSKYDNDRRKAGLYPTYGPRQPTPGNPYQATSAYPPPPRRTQPGTWQRQYTAAAGPAPTGADRYSNFPRPAPTARKDPAQDRTNVFKAWQNMNSAQDRQRGPNVPPQQGPPQQAPPQQAPPQQAPPPGSHPTPGRQRPQPPPRQEGKIPTEDQIRAGMNYRKAPPNVFDSEAMDARQSAWAAFQHANAGKAGVARNNTTKTPKKQGFNPNAPGSDERAAPSAGSHYVHRHRSEDFGRQNMPLPPPGPPPMASPSAPTSPVSPQPQRMAPDATRQRKERILDEDVPYSEGQRVRSPYSSYIGEKTDFSAERLRRSHSSRDTSKLDAEDDANRNRARSSSPAHRSNPSTGNKKPFVMYSSSEESDGDRDATQTPDESRSQQRPQSGPAYSTAPNDRPKKFPTPRNRPVSETANPASRSQIPGLNGATDGKQSDNEKPAMEQKNNIFSFPDDPDMFKSNAKARNDESIDTNFSPDGWNGAFTSEPGYFAPPTTKSRKKQSPTRRAGPSQRSSQRSTTLDVPPPASQEGETPSPRPWGSDGLPSINVRQPSQDGEGFSKEQWNKPFQDASWAWPQGQPQVNGGAASGMRRQSVSTKAAKPTNGRSQATTANGNDEAKVEGADGRTNTGAAAPPVEDVVDEGEPMDIDDSPPAQHVDSQPSSTSTQPHKEARPYAVAPSPWRQQQNGSDRDAKDSSMRPVKSTSAAEGLDFSASLDGLRSVEPIGRSAESCGFKDFAELAASLPFRSQPAANIDNIEPRADFKLPQIPKVPDSPAKLTRSSWPEYAQKFGAYLRAYHTFNATMLARFVAREKHVEDKFTDEMNFLAATGDTSGMLKSSIGYGSYSQGLREDAKAREAWNLGCERHLEAVNQFAAVREEIRRLVLHGGLPES